ncbi:conserved Plasmodium protein, unknown function [Plasmodium gallinaceum]|uniref:Uncharacterized protein n=1 Tax=Plasmodium gallinaceum TaxID=5849 RepID=A0A1J1GKS4_PLAGA|nr:conserved Plasmodium protein, unknown function [Plasmodium gallinaceum]CRG93000.1 conserved Plasmodium protein, unknown function [Plasmodium gallinaceum]
MISVKNELAYNNPFFTTLKLRKYFNIIPKNNEKREKFLKFNKKCTHEGKVIDNYKDNGMINYRRMEVNKLLKHMLHNLKDKKMKEKGENNKIEEIVKYFFNNDIITNNLNFIQFNMLLTIINKSEIKLNNKILNDIILLLHKKIDIIKSDINNTNSSWINIINILSNISKNNKLILCLIHKHLDNVKNIEIKNRGLSFVDKFIYVITCKEYNYSIREISLLLYSCYKLNIRNTDLFNFIFEKIDKNNYIFNCLDISIFVYSVHKLKLHNFIIFLEKIKKDILKNLLHFSSGHLINILLAYTYFFYNKKIYSRQIELFIYKIFNRCIDILNSFPNREFCNFLNFIIQNDFYMSEKQQTEILSVISNLINNNNSTLKINLMIDIDIFTIVNFIYKYKNDYIKNINDSVFNSLDKCIINLIKKKKMNENLLIYLLHFYKCRVNVSNRILLFFLENIYIYKLELKMKVILLTSIERYLELIQNNNKEKILFSKYYYELINCIYEDICNIINKKENSFIEENQNEIEVSIYKKKEKEILSSIDIKEILKLLKKRNHEISYSSNILNNNLENKIKIVEKMLYNKLSNYVIKQKNLELFYFVLMNKNVHKEFLDKSESIINSYISILNKFILELKKNNRSENKLQGSFIHALNLCNECNLIKRGNINNFLNNKNIILKYMDVFNLYEEKDNYFNLYVHMFLFDLNNNLLLFISYFFKIILRCLRNKEFNFEDKLQSLVDIYSSVIKVNNNYYNIYINTIYKITFFKVFHNYKKLNFKYMSLLFYSNIMHIFLHMYSKNNYINHIILSLRLLLRQFVYFLNLLDENIYNLFLINFREITKYHKRNNETQISSLISLDELIYIYRVLTIFHFVNLYKYMNNYELECFYIFYKILKFYIFKIKNFSINDFTQTHKNVSSIHSSVLNCLNGIFKNNTRINILSEKIVFPLFIIDILIYKN